MEDFADNPTVHSCDRLVCQRRKTIGSGRFRPLPLFLYDLYFFCFFVFTEVCKKIAKEGIQKKNGIDYCNIENERRTYIGQKNQKN